MEVEKVILVVMRQGQGGENIGEQCNDQRREGEEAEE